MQGQHQDLFERFVDVVVRWVTVLQVVEYHRLQPSYSSLMVVFADEVAHCQKHVAYRVTEVDRRSPYHLR